MATNVILDYDWLKFYNSSPKKLQVQTILDLVKIMYVRPSTQILDFVLILHNLLGGRGVVFLERFCHVLGRWNFVLF